MDIKVEYDGRCPNLCGGNLKVTVDGRPWTFPQHCLDSGGSVGYDENREAVITTGQWCVREWPKDYPEELKYATLTAINEQIELGCCGGCL